MARQASWAALFLGLLAVSHAEVYFKETFSDGEGYKDRWVVSKHKGADAGEFKISKGKHGTDAGLQTTPDARFFQISSAFPKFSNKDKPLVFQFSVKHEQNIDCGGGYFKILPGPIDQTDFNGETPYNIMFGPDICGSSTRKTHVILNYKGQNKLIKKDLRAETDEFSHTYTLILNPDNTYEVKIDGAEVSKGNLKDDWDFLPPKMINDPAASKPSDWVDQKEIDDPTDVKPEGWDDIPKEISDPDAKKPEDWDDELDGEWEAPLIANPEYKGEWKAKRIPNPEYKGEWVHPQIPNPDYKDDDSIYLFENNQYVGLEIWQVKAGTIFDNIIITDSVEEADKLVEATKAEREAEKKSKDKEDEERRQKDEAERKAREAEKKDDEAADEDSHDDHAGHDHSHDEL
jgi:calreticulin